ncbi:MAG: aldehyde dehydrogenase family protein [Sphingomonadales bacterium]|nr:aldehyde dehydrogenase family protein [Sphingomonadales bacterium]
MSRRLRSHPDQNGQVFINNAHADFNAPFGGFKQSGTGREWGEVGFERILGVQGSSGCRSCCLKGGRRNCHREMTIPRPWGSVVGKPNYRLAPVSLTVSGTWHLGSNPMA